MFDFLTLEVVPIKSSKNMTVYNVLPDFTSGIRNSDLMIRGGDFYAVWNEKTSLWDKDESYVIEQIDDAISKKVEELEKKSNEGDTRNEYIPKYMRSSRSGSLDLWHKYVQKQLRDSYHELDNKIIFSNTATKRRDFATRRLPYALYDGPCVAYEELMSTLYDEKERDKLEWAIGAIIAGDSKKLQKFIVLYGNPGSGKSTFLNIVQMLFEGYYTVFNAKELGSENNQFSLEMFQNNPLISIQHDGDLSKLEDNTLINSIVSHEELVVNAKHQRKYTMKFNTFLLMGTNKPVKITDAKSGIVRRLIDVYPSGKKVSASKYAKLTNAIKFELGAIANHCLKKYEEMGFHYYDGYIPTKMISATNNFYDFIDYYYDEFVRLNSITLKDAWRLYTTYAELAAVRRKMTMQEVKLELLNYFDEFLDEGHDENGLHVRNLYSGFKTSVFASRNVDMDELKSDSWLDFSTSVSTFDFVYSDRPAQLANTESGTPMKSWDKTMTKLKDINTRALHYVKVPKHHIVIDFDIKGPDGEKSFKLNYEAASKWPPTYAELSKSGSGIHLHYNYTGDPSKLSSIYDKDIEVKVFNGNSSLRRKVTKCNEIPIADINSGLPFKEEKKVVDVDVMKSEKAIRALIKKNLNKEIHGATKPSIDFIYYILEKAYANKDLVYDVSDLQQKVLYFASCSTHQSEYCINLVAKMHFKSEDEPRDVPACDDRPIIFYDVEVFPNLFLINWKFQGEDSKCVRMINPTPKEVVDLFDYRLIGFNNRRYDNHILYARGQGYTNEELYRLSQRLIQSEKGVSNGAMFANAYNLSYADIYDICSTKQSLKKWEIELGIHHQELGLPWDQPVDESLWDKVAEYCDNDVIATEAVFNSPQGQADFLARKIISELSGLSINTPTNSHSAAIIFEGNKKPQGEFIYTDLSKEFSGYKFDSGKSTYMGEEVGEGGYVYSNPGMYPNVWTFDVTSMHPHSIKALNLFGSRYTKNFYDLVLARVYIKRGDFEEAGKLFDGKLKKFLTDKSVAKSLSAALKIVINSVYGLTSAKFENPFRDPRNIDNIVAKRGALFMVTLRKKLEDMGIHVIHVKTDSIKISNPSEEVKNFIYEFGQKYGYNFEVEDIYKKFCLVNDAVYIAQHEDGTWTATGAQFAQPYVFKKLFSKEPIEFKDMCETKSVKTSMYLDMNENLSQDEHDLRFIGKVGLFCPIQQGCGGGQLVKQAENKKTGEIKYDAVTGTKGYRWLEAETVEGTSTEQYIDQSYYISLVDAAKDTISKYGDFEMFVE